MDAAKAALERLISAFNSRDHDAYEALLTDDVEAFAGVHTPLCFVGKAEWTAFVRSLERFASVKQEVRHATYRAYGGDLVLSNAYFVFTTTASDGTVDVQSGRQSVALVAVDGQWRIANLHFSALF